MSTELTRKQHSLSIITPSEAMQIILSNSEELFLLVDLNLQIILASQSTKDRIRDIFGIPCHDGMEVLKLVPEERREHLKRIYNAVFEGHTRKTIIEVSLAGKQLIMENTFRPARNNEGEIIGALVSARDVTEKKRAEEDLKLFEERWRFALDGGKQGVWDWNMKTNEIFYSNSYKRMYGFDESDEMDHLNDWEKQVHPDDRNQINQAIEQYCKSNQPYYECTYRVKGKDGRYRWILSRGMLIGRDEKGEPLRMIGTHTDVSEEVEARERLALSESQYRTLFQFNPLPCWIYDVESLGFLEVNEAAVKDYGYSRDEFFNSDLFLVHDNENRQKLIDRLKIEKSQPNLAINNWMHLKKNGEVMYVDIRSNAIRYNNREARLVVAHDVTPRVLAERELKKSNERFFYAAKASSEALWEWNVLTGEAYISEAYTNILGWEVIPGSDFNEWHDYIHPLDKEETINGYYEALKDPTKDHWEKEYRCLKKDGSYATVFDKASIIRDENGKAITVIGAIKDISKEKNTEEELRKSNERYLLASRAASDAIYDWDISNEQLHWSEGLYTLFGFKPEQIRVYEWKKLIHPSERDRISKGLGQTLRNERKKFWREEYRFKKADGSYSYVLDRGFIMRDDEGKAIRMIGSMQDITERKNNEQILSLERSVFELSANPDADLKEIVETLLDGIENSLPGAITSVLVLQEDETVRHLAAPRIPASITAFINNKKLTHSDTSCGAAISQKKPVIVNDIETDPLWDGFRDIVRPLGLRSCWSFPIIHSSGKVLGVLAVFHLETKEPKPFELSTIERTRNILRIIMENRWSLQEIKTANERFDIMMQATHDLIWDWNIETNRVYRDKIGVKKVYGMDDPSQLNSTQKWLDHIHEEDRHKLTEMVSAILEAKLGDKFEVEYRFRREDGSYADVYDRGILLRNEAGKPIRVIGAAQDISERKRMEKQILQNELERKKAISQATIDTQERERGEIGKELHDNVNQVLTTTKLYLDLALNTPEMKDELVRKSSENIIRVINEIRQLSRSLMDPTIGDLGLIASIYDLIDSINLTQKLHVRLKADHKVEDNLDRNQKLTVFRIIQETLNNAIKHAAAKSVTITLQRLKDSIELTIEDDGIGFDIKNIKKGAGLKNIENRVYLINGILAITGNPERGCRININFPLHHKTRRNPK